MQTYCNGVCVIAHKTTGTLYEIDRSDIEFDAVGQEERGMGPETHWSALFDHPQLGQLVWDIWEYPAGAENMKQTDAGGHRIVVDFDYGLGHTRD